MSAERGRVLRVAAIGLEPAAVAGEQAAASNPPAVHAEGGGGAQDAEPVTHAGAESDRRRLGEVAAGARDLADREAQPDRLAEHLVVEQEVVRVLLERQRLEDGPRESAEAGVVLGELGAEEQVL